MLPPIHDRNDYRTIYAKDEYWLPAMQLICARHGLEPATLERQELGTHVVFRTGRVILKLFCPLWPADYPAEQTTLEYLQDIPAPELITSGNVEGWPYIVMTRLPGQPALTIWDDLDDDQQRTIISQLGEMMRILHSHPPIQLLATDWDVFLAKRLATWREHHQPPQQWIGWLAQQLEDFREPPFEPVLLNGDITADHLLLSQRAGSWFISGLIDFGDALMGHPYYDFVAPLTYFTLDHPRLSRLLLESYGLELTRERALRLTAYCFLHRFGCLSDYLARFPAIDGPDFYRALWGDI